MAAGDGVLDPSWLYKGPITAFACWGAELKSSQADCTEGFVNGKAHFKSKLCPVCRTSVMQVPVARVRVATEQIQKQVAHARPRISLSPDPRAASPQCCWPSPDV